MRNAGVCLGAGVDFWNQRGYDQKYSGFGILIRWCCKLLTGGYLRATHETYNCGQENRKGWFHGKEKIYLFGRDGSDMGVVHLRMSKPGQTQSTRFTNRTEKSK